MKKLRNISAIGFLLWSIGMFVYAQTIVEPNPLQFTVLPETPGPNEKVSISIQGVGSFLGDAEIAWQVNGTTALSGVGEKDFSLVVGGLGSQTKVHVVVKSATRGTMTHDFVFMPSVVNMLWESNTYTPPFYQGKALFSAGSLVKVIALPSVVVRGATVSSNNLSFQWSRNETPLPDQSGTGKDTLAFAGNQFLKQEQVSVDVYLGATKIARGDLILPVSTPSLVLYPYDPLRGVLWESALPSGISLASKEISLQAIPYFFSSADIARGNIEYTWTLNGTPATGPNSNDGLLTLRQTGSGQGGATLSVSVQNAGVGSFLQSARATLQIVFGTQSSVGNSFFGL